MRIFLAGVSCVGKTTIGAKLAEFLAPIETPELCKVPGLQCIMAAAHVRLNEARGCSTLRPCCIASGTQARFAAAGFAAL